MSKTIATVFVATGSLLTGFANCMGLGCHESPSNRTGGNYFVTERTVDHMNTYTIREMREKFDIPSSTLRYYEDIGLFPEVKRTETNQRIYTDEHIDRLHAINCFKRTGLPMSKMHDFFDYSKDLPCHIDDIILMMEDHEKDIMEQMEKMQEDLKHIQQKVRYYNKIKTAMEQGNPWPCFEEC